jgi:transglutaminase-like putative cysteine protease
MSAVMTERSERTDTTPEERAREPWSLRTLRALSKTLAPEDGWLTVVLLAAVVYTTILSIQSANPPWVPGKMALLTNLALAGMLLGYLVVQIRRLPEGLTHPLAIALGVAYAYQQTAVAEFPQSGPEAVFISLKVWFTHALLSGESSADSAVFLFLLALLTFLLAYISFWLALRARRPWLAILANCTVLLINIGWAGEDMLLFLVFFLLLALLLLVRFNFAENLRMWRARRLRYSPDLGWDFMQTGAIFAVVVLLLAYLLPAGTASTQALAYLNDPAGAWQQAQNSFVRIFGGVNGAKGTGGLSSAGGLFGDSLRLVGTVNLSERQVLHYTPGAPTDGSEYLIAQTFDKYDGTAQWTDTVGVLNDFGADATMPSSGSATRMVTYSVTYDTIGGAGQKTLLAPGAEPALFSVTSNVTVSSVSHATTGWRAQASIANGQSYLAKGYVTTGTVQQLRAVPLPSDATGTGPLQFTQSIIKQYVDPNSSVIAAEVSQAARDATKGTTNMYDAATAIQDYLRTFKYSPKNDDPPAGQDAVVWFLKRQVGFCTFFASAMTLMARSLGMPARMATGFTSGAYDTKTGNYIVKENASHAWTQIYFAKYGWVNFEPTSSFGLFARPVPAQDVTATPGAGAGGSGLTPTPNLKDKAGVDPNIGPSTGPTSSPVFITSAISLSVVLLLALLAALIGLIWWRSLFRNLPRAAALFGRVTRLGGWAGAPPQVAQTPNEYATQLGQFIPQEREDIKKLGEAYTLGRWGRGVPSELANDLPDRYHRVQRALTREITQRAWRLPWRVVSMLRPGAGRDAHASGEREDL